MDRSTARRILEAVRRGAAEAAQDYPGGLGEFGNAGDHVEPARPPQSSEPHISAQELLDEWGRALRDREQDQ